MRLYVADKEREATYSSVFSGLDSGVRWQIQRSHQAGASRCWAAFEEPSGLLWDRM